MEMQGLKASVLMGKLKQHLPPGVSPDTGLFLDMFLICLPPSMREALGASNPKTAAVVVNAVDALWNARGGHDPTVAATTTQRNRSPSPTGGKKGDKRYGNARSKSRPLPAPISIPFTTLAMVCANFTITTLTRLTGVLHPVLGQKTELPLNPFWFGGHSSTHHCHDNAFSSKCWIDFFDR